MAKKNITQIPKINDEYRHGLLYVDKTEESAAFLAFTKALILDYNESTPFEAYEEACITSLIAWNIAGLVDMNDSDFETILDEMIKTDALGMPVEVLNQMTPILKLLVDLKIEHFEEEDFMIGDISLNKTKEGFYLKIEMLDLFDDENWDDDDDDWDDEDEDWDDEDEEWDDFGDDDEDDDWDDEEEDEEIEEEPVEKKKKIDNASKIHKLK